MLTILCAVCMSAVQRPLLLNDSDGNATYAVDMTHGKMAMISSDADRWSSDGRNLLLILLGKRRSMMKLGASALDLVSQPAPTVGLGIVSPYSWNASRKLAAWIEDDRLHIGALDGTGKQVVIPAKSGLEDSPRLSPDGKWVAFSRGVAQSEVWIVTTDGKGLRKLGKGAGAHWSADGKSLIAVEFSGDLPGRIVEYDLASGRKSALPGRLRAYQAAYSPDGTRIAALANRQPSRRLDIELLLLDRSGRVQRDFKEPRGLPEHMDLLEMNW